MTGEKALHIEQIIVAEPGATIRDVQQQVIIQRPPPGIPFQAPPLPDYFVPRPEVSAALKAHLLADAALAPGVLVVSAIYGLGGIGKSTLAAALAHDREVQTHFPDGVLWATLGQQPDLLSLLSGWVQALGDYDFRPTTVEAASAHLLSLLHDKAALLVVDDAWNPAHPGPFRVGGTRCQVVITTRETLIAQAVGATLYDLDVMTPAQALALLAGRLRRDLAATERDQALALAGAVGYLPLALELAAAQVADGLPWAELLADLRAEIARLESLDLAEGAAVADEASRKRLSLLASFGLSLRRLPAEKRRHFAWLGVLPEDASLTPAMATTLWETDERTASETLRYLRGKALLLPGVPRPDGAPTYRLHDLLHDLARRLLTAPAEPARTDDLPGLGLTLAAAHAALLDRYRARTSNKLWYTLPDDGYVHPRLAWHMEWAGQVQQIHDLLREETTDGRNGWYQAREKLGQTTGYLADVARAWRLAEAEFANLQSPISVGLQCRYALISASLTSLAKNIPPLLLAKLVEQGVWTPSQGLACARQVPEPGQRAEALTELAPHLAKTELLQEALTVARAIEMGEAWAKALIGLAPFLSNEQLQETLIAARATAWGWVQAELLNGIAHCLPKELLPEALAMARAIKSNRSRAKALIALLSCLPKEEERATTLQQALAAMQMVEEDPKMPSQVFPELPLRLVKLGYPEETWTTIQAMGITQRFDAWPFDWRDETRAWLIPHLPKKLIQDTQATVGTISDIGWRAKALAGLGYTKEALAIVRVIEDSDMRVYRLLLIVPHLPAEMLLREALVIAHEIKSKDKRAEALGKIALQLIELGHLREALDIVRTIDRHPIRAEVLAKLATPRLTPTLLQEALAIARATIWEEPWMVLAIVKLTAYLLEGDEQRIAALGETLAVIRNVARAAARTRRDVARAVARTGHVVEAPVIMLTKLAPLLPHNKCVAVLVEALAQTQAIGDADDRAKALVGLAPHLPKRLLPEALAALQMIRDPDNQVKALVELAPHLTETLLWEGLDTVKKVKFERIQAEALAKLAPHLREHYWLLRKALSIARAIPKHWRTEALAGLAPYITQELLPEVLDMARGIEDDFWRAKILVGLASRLTEELLLEALVAARMIKDDFWRARILGELLPHLPEVKQAEALQEARSAAQAIWDKERRAEALAGLAPHLPEGEQAEVLREALTAAWAIWDHWKRAEVLAGLAPQLAELGYPQEALATVQAIEAHWERAEALTRLAPRLVELDYPQEALAAARMITDKKDQAEALTRLIPHLPEAEQAEVLGEALAAARAITGKDDQAKALARLISHLPKAEQAEVLQEALVAARAITDKKDQAEALTRLVPHLPEAEQAEVLQEALTAARAIWDEDKVKALARLAPHLPEVERAKILGEALTAARAIENAKSRAEALVGLVLQLPERAEALAGLAPHLAGLPRQRLYPLWRETLPLLATRIRQDLLSDLHTLEPVIAAALGGPEAVAETFRAIQDVGRWWP